MLLNLANLLDLSLIQFFLALIFAWSGFVRSGSFDGTLFTLPFCYLCIMTLDLLAHYFNAFYAVDLINDQYLSRGKSDKKVQTEVNWWFIRYSVAIMTIPKIAGVIGLLVLP